jgi:hypothetical protein
MRQRVTQTAARDVIRIGPVFARCERASHCWLPALAGAVKLDPWIEPLSHALVFVPIVSRAALLPMAGAAPPNSKEKADQCVDRTTPFAHCIAAYRIASQKTTTTPIPLHTAAFREPRRSSRP